MVALSAESKQVDEPEGCAVANHYPCAIRFLKNEKIQIGSTVLYGRYNSSLLVVNKNNYQVLTGAFWISSVEEDTIKNPLFNIRAKGDLWIEKQVDESILVRNLDAQIEILGHFLVAEQKLPKGFENWYLKLNTENKVEQGMLRPIDKQKTSREIISILSQNGVLARQKLGLYKTIWRDSIIESANLYQEVVTRRAASLEEKENRKQAKKEAEKQEQEKMRAMFRERFYLDRP